MKVLNVLPVVLSAVLLVCAITLNRGSQIHAQTPETEASKTEQTEEPEFDLTAIKQEDAEMRGVWVSYMTLNMQGGDMSGEAFREKFKAIAENVSDGGFNTLIVQVRPFCDALYKSEIFPMSHLLTGEQGKDCGYDPLEIMCETAHEKGLKIHAWINPYRVKTESTPQSLSKDNPYIKNKNLGSEIENGIFLNPALDEVTKLIVDGVKEIVEKYDVDGIQFDDYFYPTQDASFDEKEYGEYCKTAKENALGLSQWRKENVNKMLRTVYKTVHENGNGAVFGISPQGNMANNEGLSADVVRWCTESGYADYICPQIYFSLDNPALTFEAALKDWTALTPAENVKMYVGIAGYKAGSDSDGGTWEDNSDILSREIDIIRDEHLDGFMLYSYDSIVSESAAQEIQNVISMLN